jgi:hypothetical protein
MMVVTIARWAATLPHYSDYHRTVVGFHGTKRSTALEIVQGNREFEPSTNDDDWLGNGIYFWEYAPQQAFSWAATRKAGKKWTEDIAVLGSMIRLGNCFDLLDPGNAEDLSTFYKAYRQTLADSRAAMPPNVRQKRLNCSVFEFAFTSLEKSLGQPVDTCRAVFLPAKASKSRAKNDTILWKACGINPLAHVQICVRNTSCILGTWLVKPDGG